MTDVARTKAGTFQKGVSGNPAGRPEGSKNKMTLLRQSLELSLREQSEDKLPAILDTAMSLALEGDRTMIKLLLELHMTKAMPEDAKAAERVAIQINAGSAEVKDVKPTEDIDNE